MITYITSMLSRTGVGRYAYDLYNIMQPESKIKQIIFRNRDLDPVYKDTIVGSNIYLLNYAFTRFIYSSIIKEINNSKDIIHITSPFTKPMFKSKKMVVTIHDIILFKPKFLVKGLVAEAKNSPFRKYILNYTEFKNIITVSNYVKNDIIKYFNINENKIEVIPPYISNSFYLLQNKNNLRKELNLPEEKKLILSISSDEPRKNLKMVKEISEKIGNDYQLVRVGPAVGNSITFNNLSIEQLNKLYNACDVFIFPTYEEGFGFPPLEAMKTGLPVVASNIEVMKENIGNTAILADPDNVEDNIDGIYKAIENKDYFIKKGFENLKKYSPEVIRGKLQKYYGEIKE